MKHKLNQSMKTFVTTLALVASLLAGGFGTGAAEKHEQGHKHGPSPRGGRLLEKTEPHAELVIEPDRSVSIHFYNEDLKPVPATTQTVTVVADAKGGKATLGFEKKGDSLASKGKLPDGDGYTVVVQFRQTAEAKPMNLRFKLDLSLCAECKRAEYACTCEH